MGKGLLPITAAIFLVIVLFEVTISAYGKTGELNDLPERADGVVVVEIISTDYTLTAADGPMYAEAKVLKVLKGNIPRWRRLRFGETAWWSPNYKEGERRILFLNRVERQDEYFRANWQSTYTGKVDFFWLKDSLQDLSQESLSGFLDEIEDARLIPPTFEFHLTRKDAATWSLFIDVVNETSRTFWLNPSRIELTLDIHQVRYSHQVDWGPYQGDTWIQIGPTFRISGFFSIHDDLLEQADGIKVMLSHLGACFPQRSWVGFHSFDIRPKEEDDIREAVFRYQFHHNASALQQNAKVYFLSVGIGDRDPSGELMERFEEFNPPVKKVSEAVVSVTGVKDKESGGEGLIFRVTSIRWISDCEVEVEGGYHEAPESASGNTYRLLREAGRWSVKEYKMYMIK